MKTYHFLSGLPRTGSTLLASILNQHPSIHVSATSALLDLLVAQANAMQLNRGLYEITNFQEIEVYNGMIDSYYKHIDKDIIFDKHRAWPNLIPALYKMGFSDVKVICTNRPVADIVSSYITLIDKNPEYPNFIDELIINKNLEINTSNRAMTIWNDYVQIPHTVLKNAISTNRNNLLFINYDDIINDPKSVIDTICTFFKIQKFDGYDFTNIVNNQPEKDENGWKLKDLHVIRPELKKVSVPPEKVIGPELTNYFNQFNLVF
jgi:sulfotransferase